MLPFFQKLEMLSWNCRSANRMHRLPPEASQGVNCEFGIPSKGGWGTALRGVSETFRLLGLELRSKPPIPCKNIESVDIKTSQDE